jgi:hypothetical protein
VNVLIEHHADVNIQDNLGNTPLHYAAELGYLDCIQALVQKAKPNFKLENKLGQTSYDLAEKGNQMAKALLENVGANHKGGKKSDLPMAPSISRKITLKELPKAIPAGEGEAEPDRTADDPEIDAKIDLIKRKLLAQLANEPAVVDNLLNVERKILAFDPIVLIELVPQLRYCLFGGLSRLVPIEGGIAKASRILDIISCLADPAKFQQGVLGLGSPLPPLTGLKEQHPLAGSASVTAEAAKPGPPKTAEKPSRYSSSATPSDAAPLLASSSSGEPA